MGGWIIRALVEIFYRTPRSANVLIDSRVYKYIQDYII
jgi:hypothetical protein